MAVHVQATAEAALASPTFRPVDGSDVVGSAVVATETAITGVTSSSMYSANLPDGTTKAWLISGGQIYAEVDIVAAAGDAMTLETDAVDADALAADAVAEIQDGLATTADIEALQGSVTIISPFDPDTQTLTLVRGDSYLEDNSREVEISVDVGTQLPNDITGSTVFLRVQDTQDREQPLILDIEGTIVTAVGPTKEFTFEITKAQTDTLIPGDKRYQGDIEVLIGGVATQTATAMIIDITVLRDARDED